MKTRTIISTLFLFLITILYYFGFCEWDLWVYLLCILGTIVYMMIFMKQQKKYARLSDLKDEIDRIKLHDLEKDK